MCIKHGLWLHVDAAWAGTAMILEEYQWMTRGLELADSFVFNPHKWLFTNFDCSAYFVKDHNILRKTFLSIPEYLKTQTQGVNNYSEWGIQLGRRFRALKLWFVLRNFGAKELRHKVRTHIQWAKELAEKLNSHDDYELLAPAPLSNVCFRYIPGKGLSESQINKLNERLLKSINQSGLIYLTHTKLNKAFALRFVVGQTYQQKKDIDQAWNVIQDIATSIIPTTTG